MAYRNLTQEQFKVVKDAAAKICTSKGLMTIGDFKRIGNQIIDQLEKGVLTYANLLQAEIPFKFNDRI